MSGRVTISDVRRAGHCVSGAKAWFDRHDLDFRDFIKNGIDEETFLASGDALAAGVVEHKRKLGNDG
ncbi:MAG: hypothetical protein E5V74_01705 [Mesorhizobium sp.]|nr:MAG: hypothetical protein E5V74_01705 [Mesorhizobium sp.]